MKARILKHHLLPVFGDMPLDAIKMHPIEVLKGSLLAKGLSRKRVNNILACLGKMLRCAHEVELLEVVRRVKLLKIPQQKFDFLSFELSRLTEAVKIDPERWALVLLGADAGLRQGEIIALEWGDVDLVAGALTVRRSSWKGQVGTPKSGRQRKVPLTARLKAALKPHRHLKSGLVLGPAGLRAPWREASLRSSRFEFELTFRLCAVSPIDRDVLTGRNKFICARADFCANPAGHGPLHGMTRYLRYRILLAATIAVLGFSGAGCSSNGSPAGTGAGGASSGGTTGGGGATGSGGGAGGPGTGGAASGGSLGSGGVAASGSAAGGSAGAAGGAGLGAGGAAGNTGGAGGACPAPSATGELVTSLAGTWTFTPSGAAATTITVPGGGWVAQGFRSTNEANYQRMAMVPDLGRAQATYLEFGAVNHQATLTVDSTKVGTQTTSYTPSVWDVTSVVKPGMSHSFTVDVKGRNALKGSSGKKLVPDAAGWSSNVPQGIFRSAILHVVPALHVFETLVRTDVAADQFSIDVWVKNDAASAATATVDVGLSSWTCDGTTYPSVPSKSVSVPAGQTIKVTLGPITWGLGAASYWWPNVPYVEGYRAKLHVARVTVTPDAAGGGAAAAHSIPVRFGFRQSRQVTAHYELNGVPIKFRGDNIQGADYDSIKTAGAKDKSDAYDLFPGFLPPSANNPGWPQAVDNLQRLNFNVARLHQEPVSPYMLDVMDEMGMMVIDESAIRGSNNDQDFQAGSANMIAHVSALVHRDRNHPSVIRWSQCNEPEGDNTNSSAFQQQLYQAMVAADDTRPVSADASGSGPNIMNGYGVTAANFAVFEHYPSGFGSYTHDVAVSTTHPYGDGEFIWPADNSAQGLMWFATSTVTLRQKDPSDIRPYTLLSSWASFVPGVKSNMMTIEQGGPPLYSEDNLPTPWANPIITRVQRAFNPVAVIDTAYWDANHASDKSGAWPISKPAITKGSQVSRQLMVFNDTLSGTGVDVSWEMHQDSASGAMSGQGSMQLDIPLGGHATVTATVTAPASGTTAVLVLKSSKSGTMLFEDDGEAFALQ